MLAAVMAAYAVLQAPVADPACYKIATFIGFSGDESLAAWKVSVRCPVGNGAWDRFELMRTTDTRTGLTVESYRLSGIQRITRRGSVANVPARRLMMGHPDWRKARSREAWVTLAHQARFSADPLSPRQAAIIVVPNAESRITVDETENGYSIRGEPGQPLGFALTLVAEPPVELARFSQEARPGETLVAAVSLDRSPSGLNVAVLARFETLGDVSNPPASFGKVARLGVPTTKDPWPEDDPSIYVRDENLDLAEHLNRAAMSWDLNW